MQKLGACQYLLFLLSLGMGHASELIAFIKKHYDFTLGCAGYPEGHIEAQSLEKDIDFLKRKIDNGAAYIVSQYFYDNDFFFNYVEKCRPRESRCPSLPGSCRFTP